MAFASADHSASNVAMLPDTAAANRGLSVVGGGGGICLTTEGRLDDPPPPLCSADHSALALCSADHSASNFVMRCTVSYKDTRAVRGAPEHRQRCFS